VTTAVTRRVKPGHEAQYEEFLEGVIATASRFPGYLGTEIFRPDRHGDNYRIVYRFDDAGHLRDWLDSDEHAAWLARAEPHAAGATQTQFLTGLESWFTLPADPGAPPPPPCKMALLTWITIFPLISGIVAAFGPTLGSIPLVPRTAITTAIAVPVMTWILMPRVTRLLQHWLFPRQQAAKT
jgi:antibiotic biosynthesis monooxygenase (ABM) superfamily enzyme